jgi:hypothetical protein
VRVEDLNDEQMIVRSATHHNPSAKPSILRGVMALMALSGAKELPENFPEKKVIEFAQKFQGWTEPDTHNNSRPRLTNHGKAVAAGYRMYKAKKCLLGELHGLNAYEVLEKQKEAFPERQKSSKAKPERKPSRYPDYLPEYDGKIFGREIGEHLSEAGQQELCRALEKVKLAVSCAFNLDIPRKQRVALVDLGQYKRDINRFVTVVRDEPVRRLLEEIEDEWIEMERRSYSLRRDAAASNDNPEQQQADKAA